MANKWVKCTTCRGKHFEHERIELVRNLKYGLGTYLCCPFCGGSVYEDIAKKEVRGSELVMTKLEKESD